GSTPTCTSRRIPSSTRCTTKWRRAGLSSSTTTTCGRRAGRRSMTSGTRGRSPNRSAAPTARSCTGGNRCDGLLMVPRLLLVHPSKFAGENHGVYIQHVASMKWLLDPGGAWDVAAVDPWHPAFPELAAGSDLVVVQMLGTREVEALIRLRRARGLRTIFEVT